MRATDPVVVVDVGGTFTRMAVHDGRLGPVVTHDTRRIDLHEAIGAFARQHPHVAGIGVSVAGLVRNGEVRILAADRTLRASDLPLPTRLVNDLVATAAGIGALRHGGGPDLGGHAIALGDPIASSDGPFSVIGVGTGLGEACVVDDLVLPSEGGVSSFAPSDRIQEELLAFLRRQPVSHDLAPESGPMQIGWERVISGGAFGDLLAFAGQHAALGDEVRAALERGDPAAVVAASWETDPACALAMDLFVRALGTEASCVALRFVSTGGVYLCGGVTQHVRAALSDGRFRSAFEHNALVSDFLRAIPTWLVTHPHPALLGAASAARKEPDT